MTTHPNAKVSGGDQMWSIPGCYQTQNAPGNFFPTANRIYYFPIVFLAPATIKEARLIVTVAAASSNARIGIYTADKEWQPVALVSDFGAVSCATTGYKEITGMSVAVSAGLHLLAFNCDNSSITFRSLLGFPITGTMRPPVAGRNDNFAVLLQKLSSTYGALPSTVQPYDSYIDNSGSPSQMPIDLKWTT